MDKQKEAAVADHYSRGGLGEAILGALKKAGKDIDHLTEEDLAALDHFHTGGHPATLELAELTDVQDGWEVVDVGGGIGGPARSLATRYGARVTVIDLSDEFCSVGEDLTRRSGLEELVTFRRGSALEMPFEDDSFDLAWTQHSSMNIEDKEGLYSEIRRVLKTGGRLAVHEIMAGPNQPAYYPAPWADDPSISFLRPAEDVRSLITSSGFRELVWEDMTASALAFVRERAAAPPTASPVGLQIVVPDFAAKVANVGRGLTEQRLAPFRGVFEAA